MTKFEIYQEKKKKEKTVYFKLIHPERSTDAVKLRAFDKDGKTLSSGHIVAITNKGELRLCRNISEKLGLKLDKSGRIKIEK